MTAKQCIVQVDFTPETKYSTQRYVFSGWDKIKAIHLERISTDATQSSYLGIISVSLCIDNEEPVSIMNTVCITSASFPGANDRPKRIIRDQPGVPFDLMQGKFEPRTTCIADSASINGAVAAVGTNISTGEHDVRFYVDISPAPDTGDSLFVYLRLEF